MEGAAATGTGVGEGVILGAAGEGVYEEGEGE